MSRRIVDAAAGFGFIAESCRKTVSQTSTFTLSLSFLTFLRPLFLPAATARWSISAVFPPPSSYPSAQRTIEHGSIETNELNMTLMSHMTHHGSV